MFTVSKRDNAGRQPWEYVAAKADTYHAGDLLVHSGGLVKKVTETYSDRPDYICMADATVEEGETIPAIRITEDLVLKTKVIGGSTASVGGHTAVTSEGVSFDEGGCFEVTALGDGDTVYGRFHKVERYV